MTSLSEQNRRQFLGTLAASSLLSFSPAWAQTGPKAGGTLTIVASDQPTYMNAAVTTAGPEILVSSKVYEGLLDYDEGMLPKPQLAESWETSADGLSITFNLRKDVTWHDGKPFTSEDVKVSILEILKVHHGRGRVTFSVVTDIETPDAHTAIFRLSHPAPAMMSALNAGESPIMAAHLYAGTDIMNNPTNLQPVGTGPYRFVSFTRGESVVFEKNADYWDKGRPYVDGIIVRYISDGSTRAAMLESGEADLVATSQLPTVEVLRFQSTEGFEVTPKGYEYSPSLHLCDFNLRRPIFQNKLVRQAIAHALDTAWITQNIWFGFGTAGTGPIHAEQKSFYTTDGVPTYGYDLDKANALLDEAGYPRKDGDWRFPMTLDTYSYLEELPRSAEYIREQLRQIGINAEVRVGDIGAYVKRIYTERDFDMSIYTASCGADPSIGVQRFYWSKNIKDGVSFSNGSGYSNPEVDAVLEAAAIEIDREKRRELYFQFQRMVVADVPSLALVSTAKLTICRDEVKDHTVGAIGPFGPMAQVWLDR